MGKDYGPHMARNQPLLPPMPFILQAAHTELSSLAGHIFCSGEHSSVQVRKHQVQRTKGLDLDLKGLFHWFWCYQAQLAIKERKRVSKRNTGVGIGPVE
jgi:hypothetical protein